MANADELQSLQFLIELEHDPRRNLQTFERYDYKKTKVNVASRAHSSNEVALLEPPSIEGLQAGAEAGRRSYLSLSPTTIQSVGPGQILFVWHAYFHPSIGRRFSSVTLTIKFSTPPPPPPHPLPLTTSTTPSTQSPSSSSSLNIIAYGPRKAYGGLTTESRKVAWGLALPISSSSAPILPAQIGINPSLSAEHSKEVEHAFTITGTPRGSSPLHRTSVVWTMEENSSSKLGIPSEIQFATLVVDHHHQSAPPLLQVSCNLTAKTTGSGFGLYSGPHWLKAKSDHQNESMIIDPKRYVGLLKEFNFESGVEPVEGVRNLLEGWTGEVEGAVKEFGQGVFRA